MGVIAVGQKGKQMSDLISRQVVLDKVAQETRHYCEYLAGQNNDAHKYVLTLGKNISASVNKLSSVSTEKTGRWIRWYEVIESADGKSTDHIPHCKCSECGTEYDPHSSQFIKYCNECGARMQEVEG